MSLLQQLAALEKEGGFSFFPGQTDLLARVAPLNKALIAADTGTGKTLLATILARLSNANKVLVVAPRGVLAQWEREIGRFWKTTPVYRGINSKLRRPKGVWLCYPQELSLGWPRVSSRLRDKFDCVLLDESHTYSNLETRVTETLEDLNAPYRYAFSATPVGNVTAELYPVLKWLGLECESRERLSALLDAKDQGLMDWMSRHIHALEKVECNPDCVPCEFTVVRVPLPPAVQSAHLQVDGGYLGFDQVRIRTSVLRSACSRPDSNPKLDALMLELQGCLGRGEQVVVVSARLSTTQSIAERLAASGIPTARIDSTVPADNHSIEAASFVEGQASVMLMGIKCAQSYSFSNCPNLLMASAEFSFTTFWQAVGRVWRVTSPRPVSVKSFVFKDTVEERVLKTVLHKRQLAHKACGLKYNLKMTTQDIA